MQLFLLGVVANDTSDVTPLMNGPLGGPRAIIVRACTAAEAVDYARKRYSVPAWVELHATPADIITAEVEVPS